MATRISKIEPVRTFQMPAGATPVGEPFTTSTGYKYLKGIAFEYGSQADLNDVYQDVLAGGLWIDGEQVLPTDYDVKRLISGPNVKPCDRWCKLWHPIKCEGSQIEVQVKNTASSPNAHNIKMYLCLTTEEPPENNDCLC